MPVTLPVTLDDWCVFYQMLCDNVSDEQLNYCSDCGLCCHTCIQRISGGEFAYGSYCCN